MTNWLMVICLFSCTAYGQQERVFVPNTLGCLLLLPMPMKHTWEGTNEVITVDTIKVQASIDSAYQLANGAWLLDQVQREQSVPKKAFQAVKMELDRRGKGVIYKGGKPSTTLQISLSRLDNVFRFPIQQQGENFFFHRCKASYFLVCQETLVMREVMGDGATFVFRRVH